VVHAVNYTVVFTTAVFMVRNYLTAGSAHDAPDVESRVGTLSGLLSSGFSLAQVRLPPRSLALALTQHRF